jgi:hypothetical protein
MIEKFILLRASRSVSFSHQVLWNFLSGLGIGDETLSMKTVDFLQALAYHGKNAIQKIQNTHLYMYTEGDANLTDKRSLNLPQTDNLNKYTVYKGPKFYHEEPMPEN